MIEDRDMTTKCERCDGCGKIADSESGEAWSARVNMPLRSSAAILSGLVRPISCPDCDGTGQILTPDFAQRANAENNSAEPMTPEPIPPDQDPVQWLIDRVQTVIPESTQMGTEPLSTKAAVLAQLYQAQALREIVDELSELNMLTSELRRVLESCRTCVNRAEGRFAVRTVECE